MPTPEKLHELFESEPEKNELLDTLLAQGESIIDDIVAGRVSHEIAHVALQENDKQVREALADTAWFQAFVSSFQPENA